MMSILATGLSFSAAVALLIGLASTDREFQNEVHVIETLMLALAAICLEAYCAAGLQLVLCASHLVFEMKRSNARIVVIACWLGWLAMVPLAVISGESAMFALPMAAVFWMLHKRFGCRMWRDNVTCYSHRDWGELVMNCLCLAAWLAYFVHLGDVCSAVARGGLILYNFVLFAGAPDGRRWY